MVWAADAAAGRIVIDPARLDSAVRTVALRRTVLRGFRWRRALLLAWAAGRIGRETLLEIRDEYRRLAPIIYAQGVGGSAGVYPCALRP